MNIDSALQEAYELLATGKTAPAEQLCQRVLAAAPDHLEALNLRAIIAHRQGDTGQAIAALSRAIALAPTNAMPYYNRAKVLKETGDMERAVEDYRAAIERYPEFREAYFNLANLLGELGRFDKAKAEYRRALALDPLFAKAHHHLAMLSRHDTVDADIRSMTSALEDTQLADRDKVYLYFGLGKAYEDLNDFEKSFTCYSEGNRLKRAEYHYDSADEETRFSNIRSIFSKELLDRFANSGSPDRTPVFIVGMPRSGTTLVEQILASHPQVHGAGELAYLAGLIAAACRGKGIAFPGSTFPFDERDLERLGQTYLGKLRRHSSTATLITDKMPENFLYLGMIRLALPGAKIIHCRRDPMATCLSCFKQLFAAHQPYAYDLAELGHYYRLYEQLMQHWGSVMPDAILDFDYEALIDDQEGQTRRLLEHCGLPWDEACLDFHRSTRPIKTASTAQVRQALYGTSVKAWQRFGDRLQPLLAALDIVQPGPAHGCRE